jgi:hypothetical protein
MSVQALLKLPNKKLRFLVVETELGEIYWVRGCFGAAPEDQ